jgi:hypothetical protein
MTDGSATFNSRAFGSEAGTPNRARNSKLGRAAALGPRAPSLGWLLA